MPSGCWKSCFSKKRNICKIAEFRNIHKIFIHFARFLTVRVLKYSENTCIILIEPGNNPVSYLFISIHIKFGRAYEDTSYRQRGHGGGGRPANHADPQQAVSCFADFAGRQRAFGTVYGGAHGRAAHRPGIAGHRRPGDRGSRFVPAHTAAAPAVRHDRGGHLVRAGTDGG